MLFFSSAKEDVLGRHDGPVRCVEYSYAAGTCVFLNYVWILVIVFLQPDTYISIV
jgi:hypothetical protein